jgi:hypothetical protein
MGIRRRNQGLAPRKSAAAIDDYHDGAISLVFIPMGGQLVF